MRQWAGVALLFLLFLLLIAIAIAAATTPIDTRQRLADAAPIVEAEPDPAPAETPRPILTPVRVVAEVTPPVEEAPAPLETPEAEMWETSPPISAPDGEDAKKEPARLRMHVLSEDHAWAFGDSNEVVRNGMRVSISSLVDDEYFRTELCASPAVVALGTASSEGSQSLNHALAKARSETLARAIKDSAAACEEPPRVFAANLGKNKNPYVCPDGGVCHDLTAYQRRVAVVSLTDFGAAPDMATALRQAAAKVEAEDGRLFTDFKLTDYDLFEEAPVEQL